MVQFSAKVRQITRVWVVTTFLACAVLSTTFSSLSLANTASDRLLSLNPALNQTSLTDPLSALAQPQPQVMPAPSIYVRDGALVIEGQAPGNPAEVFTPLAIRQQFTLSQPGRFVLDIWMPASSSASGAPVASTPDAASPSDALTAPITLEQSPGYAGSQIRVGRFDAETLRIVIESPTPGGLFARVHPGRNAIHVPLSTSLLSETAQWRPAYPATLQTSVLKEVKLQASPLPQLVLDTIGPLPQADTRLVDWPQSSAVNAVNGITPEKAFNKALVVTLPNVQLPPEGLKITGSFVNANGQSWASGVLVQQSGADVRLIAPLQNVPPQAVIEPRLAVQEAPPNALQHKLLAMVASNSVAALNAAAKPQDSLSEILLTGKAGTLKKVPFPARVVIDAGHGGKDHGAIRAGVQEKELNLRMALWLRDALQSQGVTVYMTRDTDKFIPLPEITRFTNTVRPDLFISIHHNANNNASIAGLETYYYNANSKPFADRIHRFLIGSTGANDRGVRRAMFYVIHHTNVPAILCEMGYVSSPSERAELAATERPKRAVQGLASGVVDYLSTSALAQAKPQR